MLPRIYSLIWALLHVLVSIYETLLWLGLRLQAATLWSYDHICRSRASKAERERNLLELCRTRLSKLPRHLSIIVGADDSQVNADVLSRIFTYALIMNFDCISYYDVRLPEHGHVNLDELRAPENVHSKELQEHHYTWSQMSAVPHTNGVIKDSSNGHITNGHSKCNTQKSIEIFKITPADGRPLLADVCCSLYELRHTDNVKKLLNDRQQLTERITEEIAQRLYKMPDPELGIIFSRQMCTYGMLPWQTRFTEFHLFETGRYFNAQAFAQILYKYAHCEQRWGK